MTDFIPGLLGPLSTFQKGYLVFSVLRWLLFARKRTLTIVSDDIMRDNGFTSVNFQQLPSFPIVKPQVSYEDYPKQVLC